MSEFGPTELARALTIVLSRAGRATGQDLLDQLHLAGLELHRKEIEWLHAGGYKWGPQ